MSYFIRILCACLLASVLIEAQAPPTELRLIEIDPGHSHLSGLHDRPLPGVSNDVHIYSPVSAELASHLSALSRFNNRLLDPTHWSIHLIANTDYLDAFKGEGPGNIVALSGRNKEKLGYIMTALEAGQNVFADKPWIINSTDLPRLEEAIKLADKKHLVTYDWMTLRGDMAYRLQRDLVMDSTVFGTPAAGTAAEPAVTLENLHALLKFSNGIPQQRPASFLDVRQQGEGMADVGTHLADLVQWTLFPNREISYRDDIRMLQAEHSPLTLTLSQFSELTGQGEWPAYLKSGLVDGKLRYFANGSCVYLIRGVHVRLKVGWQYKASPGAKDSYFTSYLGTRSLIELRAGPDEGYMPQIFVTPGDKSKTPEWEAHLRAAILRLNAKYPGLTTAKTGGSYRVVLPKLENGGEDLYTLFKEFAGFVHDYKTFPSYENPNLLAKYYVTTTAVAMAGMHQ